MLNLIYRKYETNKQAQVTIEFTFAMIMALLMMYTIIKLFDWSGRDLVDRRKHYEESIFQTKGDRDFSKADPRRDKDALQLYQVSPKTYTPKRVNAVWDGI